MSSSKPISIDGNHNLVIQDVQGSHIYLNSDEGVQRLLTEQGDKIEKILQSLQAEHSAWSQQWADKIYNIQQAGTLNFNFYGERKIPHYLTPASADVPSTFLGREAEKAKIHELLFNRLQPLALVNAEGGMGKTTLAAYYWQQHASEYQHLAWLYCERGILSALQSQLPPALGILNDIEQAMKQASALGADIQEAIWQTLKTAMANLKAPCLLVLDNANDPEDIRSFLQKIKGLNWHILLTSRCSGVMTDPHSEYSITGLPPDLAKQLFKRNHSETSADFEALLDRFLLAVGYNTLCIEVFSKNLAQGADWGLSMQGLLAKLEIQGLILGEDSFEVNSNWNGQTQDVRSSDQIIEALYNLTELEHNTPALHQLLATLALLPAEGHSAEVLRTLLPAESPIVLKNELDQLVRWGWLSFAEKTYRLSPVVQKIVLQRTPPAQRWVLGEPMVKKLQDIFEAEGYHPKNIATAEPFAIIAFGITNNLPSTNSALTKLFDCLWYYYTAIGNISQAIISAEKMRDFCMQSGDKHSLAISYVKLGDSNRTLGNLQQSLTFYEDGTEIFEELYASSIKNMHFKNSLATSYQRLGLTYRELGNLQQSLVFFKKSTHLGEELYASFPERIDFKSGLATSYSKLGDAYLDLEDFRKSLQLYDDGNKLLEELHISFPESVEFKDGLAILYSKLGHTYKVLKDLSKALTFFEKYNSFREELYAAYPANMPFKNGLAISYQFLGRMHAELEDFPQALTFFEKDLKLSKELHESHPENVEFKNGLALSYQQMGSFYKNTTNDQKRAKEYYQSSQVLLKELVASFPDYVQFLKNLQWVEDKLSDIPA